MKRIALATAFLFASSMFVMAQSTSTPSSTDQQQPSATSPSSQSAPTSTMPSTSQSDQNQSGAMGSQSGNAEKIEGCLSQGANGYTLASASGTTYNLTGDTSKLASHVGEQVEVKGSPSSSAAAATSPNASATGAGASASAQNFEVKSVKRIAKSCSTSSPSSSQSPQ
ncbi:MAG: hypothetical protein ACM3JB_07040 [Acidobacteriaceae bacterium]